MKRARGFTLLELLIGMTLLAFILALLFAGFRLASRSWDAVETRVERNNDEAMARLLVRRLLTQLQPVRWKKTLNQPVTFEGDRLVLRGLAPLSGQAGASGLRLIELSQEADATDATGKAGRALILRQAPLRYDAEKFTDGLAEAKPHVILNGLDGIEFSFFGPAKRGEPATWQDAWLNPEQLPQLIRVRLASPERGWSDMIVAPKIGGTGCRWDNFHKICR